MKAFIIVAISSFLLLSSLANAHSRLKYSAPQNGDMLNMLPEKVMLEFSSKVKLVKLQLVGKSGKQIKLITKPRKTFDSSFSIALPMLANGKYKVNWVAMGSDAHKMKGNFIFSLHVTDMEKIPASLENDKKND